MSTKFAVEMFVTAGSMSARLAGGTGWMPFGQYDDAATALDRAASVEAQGRIMRVIDPAGHVMAAPELVAA